jgi:hypothetical protein
LKKDGYAGPLGTLLNKSLPNVAVLDPFHELVQPSLNISDARHLPSPSPTYSINRVPSGSNLSIMQSLNPPSRSQTKCVVFFSLADILTDRLCSDRAIGLT